MGCPVICNGYELMQDLDFDSDASGAVDAADAFGGNFASHRRRLQQRL